MVSTANERRAKINSLLSRLLGQRIITNSRRRPSSLPRGINYTEKEWNILHSSEYTIQRIWELEALEQKYMTYLMLAKLEN